MKAIAIRQSEYNRNAWKYCAILAVACIIPIKQAKSDERTRRIEVLHEKALDMAAQCLAISEIGGYALLLDDNFSLSEAINNNPKDYEQLIKSIIENKQTIINVGGSYAKEQKMFWLNYYIKIHNLRSFDNGLNKLLIAANKTSEKFQYLHPVYKILKGSLLDDTMVCSYTYIELKRSKEIQTPELLIREVVNAANKISKDGYSSIIYLSMTVAMHYWGKSGYKSTLDNYNERAKQ